MWTEEPSHLRSLTFLQEGMSVFTKNAPDSHVGMDSVLVGDTRATVAPKMPNWERDFPDRAH